MDIRTIHIQTRALPFLFIIGVLCAMYGGVATPSETAAVGALLCLIIAITLSCIFPGWASWLPNAVMGMSI